MRTRILLTIAATATILAGCSNEETNEVIDSWDGEIRLSSGLAVQTRADTPSDQGAQIASGQTVGVFINSKGSGTPSVAANLKYDADGSGILTLNTTGGQQATPFYPSDGSNVKIVAYQPHNTDATNAFTGKGGSGSDETYDFTVKTDQSTSNKDYYDSDLLYAKIDDAPRKADAHELKFTHKLSKIICILKTDISSPTLTSATVSIVNAETKVTFKPSDGTLTATNSSSKADVKMNSTITTNTYIAIIPPQTFAENAKFLEVSVGTGKFYYKIPDNPDNDKGLELQATKAYKYDITVKSTELKVSSSITDWDGKDAQASTGDATMDEPTSGDAGGGAGAGS